MNGIVHVCSHPDDANPHFRITEEKIFKDILHYIEVNANVIMLKHMINLISCKSYNHSLIFSCVTLCFSLFI